MPHALKLKAALPVLLAATMAGCASAPAPRPIATTPHVPRQAIANLAAASGTLVSGRLTLATAPGGVRIRGDIGGLSPGSLHGFHVHEKGDCSSVDASSAGGHFNPEGKPHGRAGQGPHHTGDADNLVADASGVAHLNAWLPGAALGDGSPHDLSGRAIIVHAGADDYASQPSGNAGARVACGVIRLLP